MFFRKAFGLAAALALCAAPAMADDQDFTVHNHSGHTIKQFYVSLASHDTWEEDVLGDGVLADGASTKIQFKGWSHEDCKWDVKAVYDDGAQSIDHNVDLCSVTDFEYTPN